MNRMEAAAEFEITSNAITEIAAECLVEVEFKESSRGSRFRLVRRCCRIVRFRINLLSHYLACPRCPPKQRQSLGLAALENQRLHELKTGA